MTELSHSPDDEIVSAVLDGEATAAEQARVEADPELRHRMAEMSRVREQVAAPVTPLDELTMRRLVDRAAAELGGTARAGQAVGRPAPLRAEPPWWRRGVGIGLGSAAALVLLALLVGPALFGGFGSDDDESADVAATSADEDSEPNILSESFDDSAGGAADDRADEGSDADDASGDDAAGGPDATVESDSEEQALGQFGEHESVEGFALAMREQAEPAANDGESDDAPPVTTTQPARVDAEPIEELFARCGDDALDDYLTSDSTVIAQAEGFVDDVRMFGFAIDRIDDLVVVIIDTRTCDVVAVG